MLNKIHVPPAGSLVDKTIKGASKWSDEVLSCPDRSLYPGLDHSLPDLLRFARIVSREMGLKRKDLALFHVEAKHDWWPGFRYPFEGGEIAAFVATHQKLVDMRYRAYDPSIKRDNFSNVPNSDDGQAIRDLSLKSFRKLHEAVCKQLLEHNRLPIIFSLNAFSGSLLNTDQPIWRLPGLHFHRGSVAELLGQAAEMRVASGLEETVASFMRSRYGLHQDPVVEVIEGRRYRMWWCNSEIGAAPPRKEPTVLKMRPRPQYDKVPDTVPLPRENESFPRFM